MASLDKNRKSVENITTTTSGTGFHDYKTVAASGASLMHPSTMAQLKLQEYLENYIDGYLFCDLESMATLIPKDLHPGAAGYPMILTICAGMELLGALLAPTKNEKFNDSDGIKYFGHYWKYYLSVSEPNYKKYGQVMRSLVRNGLAHMFMTKPRIGVVKSNPVLHLQDFDNHLIIDAVRLYEDFKRSYIEVAKPVILDGGLGTQLASNRLNQIISQYTIESNETLKNLIKESKDALASTTTLPPTIS